jgi:hypothetical protein
MAIVYFLIPLIVWAFFIIGAKFLPLPAKDIPQADEATLQAAAKKHGKVVFYTGASMFLFVPILTFLLTKLLGSFQQLVLRSQLPNTQYLIGISIWAFAIPSLFLAIFIFGIIGIYFINWYKDFKHADQNEWNMAMYYINKQSTGGTNLDTNKLALILAIVGLPIIFIAIFFGMNTYTIFTNSEMTDNSYFSSRPKTYSYNQISKVLHLGQYKNRQTGEIESTSPSYAILMSNGYKWSTLNTEINNTEKETELINFVSQQSGQPITEGVHNVDDKQ